MDWKEPSTRKIFAKFASIFFADLPANSYSMIIFLTLLPIPCTMVVLEIGQD